MTEERLSDMTLDELRSEARSRISQLHSIFDKTSAALEAWYWRMGEKGHEGTPCSRCGGVGHLVQFSEADWAEIGFRYPLQKGQCPDCKGTGRTPKDGKT
jgi:hypothetical protein